MYNSSIVDCEVIPRLTAKKKKLYMLRAVPRVARLWPSFLWAPHPPLRAPTHLYCPGLAALDPASPCSPWICAC